MVGTWALQSPEKMASRLAELEPTRVVFNNDDILAALGGGQLEILPAPGLGKLYLVQWAFAIGDWTAGAYNYPGSSVDLIYGASTPAAFGPHPANGVAGTFGDDSDRWEYFFQGPGTFTYSTNEGDLTGMGLNGYFGISSYENKAVNLNIQRGSGEGPPSGGDPANTLKVHISSYLLTL